MKLLSAFLDLMISDPKPGLSSAELFRYSISCMIRKKVMSVCWVSWGDEREFEFHSTVQPEIIWPTCLGRTTIVKTGN